VTRAILLIAILPFLAAAAPAKDWKREALADAGTFIDRANDEWTQAIVSGDGNVLSAPYAADGVFVGPMGRACAAKQRCAKCTPGAAPTCRC
jgi:hypothetical protein